MKHVNFRFNFNFLFSNPRKHKNNKTIQTKPKRKNNTRDAIYACQKFPKWKHVEKGSHVDYRKQNDSTGNHGLSPLSEQKEMTK